MTLPFSPYQEIVAIAERFAPGEGEFATAVGNLFISRRSEPTPLSHSSYRPCLALVLQGAKGLLLGTEAIDYAPGEYLLTSFDLPVSWAVTQASAEKPHFCLCIMIDHEKIAELLRRAEIPLPALPAENQRGITVNTAPPELLDAVVRLMRLLDHPTDIPAVAPLIEQEILYRLLTGPDGARLLNIAITDSNSSRIARAIAWLRQNFALPLRIEDLAERANMSVSSFHHHFKAATAMTPVQFQKKLRLHEARRLMLMERLDVSNAGHRVGYQSPSQFSREYSRLYGISPAKDVAEVVRNVV